MRKHLIVFKPTGTRGGEGQHPIVPIVTTKNSYRGGRSIRAARST
jgi:hypothetical protein